MTPSPTITVITPTFNQARYLERTICSVLDQGYPKLEYIVVDGGSVDGSQDIIKQYEDAMAWWISVSDGGPACAINKALQHITGDLVAFLSSDNLYLPFALHEVAEAWKRQGEPAWMVGKSQLIDGEDEEVSGSTWPMPRDLADYLRGDCDPISGSATFFRADVVREFAPLNATLQHQFMFDFNCRLMAAGITPTVMELPVTAERRHRNALRNRDAMACRRERRKVTQQYLEVLHTPKPEVHIHAA